MKIINLTKKLAILCCLFGTMALTAQSDYTATMQALKMEFEASNVKADFIELKNKYARVAVAEPTKWLPSYYETLCTIAWAFEEKEETVKAKLADQIDLMVTNLENRVEDNVEINVLRGRLLQLKVGIRSDDQLQTGLQLFESISSTADKYPNNPRALLLMGQIIVYSPKNFMGFTDEEGIEYIRKSIELLKDVKHTDSINPSWGYDEATGHLDHILKPQTKFTSQEVDEEIEETTETEDEEENGIDESEILDAFYSQGGEVDYEKEAKSFKALIEKDPSNPVWYYHQAFCYVQRALTTTKIEEIDILCLTANQILKKIPEGISKDEIYCLEALIEVTKIRVNFNARGLKYCLKSESLLDKAIQLNPNNARAYFLKGQNKRNIPKSFGGGLEAAKKYFVKSKELYDEQDTANASIRWGQNEVNQIVSNY